MPSFSPLEQFRRKHASRHENIAEGWVEQLVGESWLKKYIRITSNKLQIFTHASKQMCALALNLDGLSSASREQGDVLVLVIDQCELKLRTTNKMDATRWEIVLQKRLLQRSAPHGFDENLAGEGEPVRMRGWLQRHATYGSQESDGSHWHRRYFMLVGRVLKYFHSADLSGCQFALNLGADLLLAVHTMEDEDASQLLLRHECGEFCLRTEESREAAIWSASIKGLLTLLNYITDFSALIL